MLNAKCDHTTVLYKEIKDLRLVIVPINLGTSECSCCAKLGGTKRTDPKREMTARTVYEKEAIATETPWFSVRYVSSTR